MPFTDYLNALRYNQLFGDAVAGSNQMTPGMPSSPGQIGMDTLGSEPYMGIDQMGPMSPAMSPSQMPEPYVPEHQASDFLTHILSSLPERHKPTVLNKIFASLSAVGNDPAGIEQNLNGDYNDQMKDWQTKAAAATSAAGMERQNNILAQQAHNTNESRRIAQQRADEYVNRGRVETARQESMARDREAKQKIDQQKVEIQQFNAMNQGVYTWKQGNDGFLYGINNKTGKSFKTDIKGIDLSPLEKHNLKMEEIEASGEEARKTKETVPGVAEKTPTTTTTSSTTEKAGVKSTTQRTVTSGPSGSAATVLMKDKNGKTWRVAPQNVAAFKKANGIK